MPYSHTKGYKFNVFHLFVRLQSVSTQSSPILAILVPFWFKLTDILAQANTYKPVANGDMTIGVKSHALVTRHGGHCTEVRRGCIITPIVTRLVTITRVTGNEESGV